LRLRLLLLLGLLLHRLLLWRLRWLLWLCCCRCSRA
jgi:hypothetical protein